MAYFEFEYKVSGYSRRSIEAPTEEEAWEKFYDETEKAIDEARDDLEVEPTSVSLAEVID